MNIWSLIRNIDITHHFSTYRLLFVTWDV